MAGVTKLQWQLIAFTAAAVLAGVAIRAIFPIRVVSVTPPKIIAIHDTVKKVDTLWRVRLVSDTKWDTVYLERVTIEKPDTVEKYVPNLEGISAVFVPKNIGDSAVAQGFLVDSGHVKLWKAQWWAPGPLRAISADTFPPRISFYPAIEQAETCGTGCAIRKYLTGGIVGVAITGVACIVR